MSQYFRLVNPDLGEFVSLPGLANASGRVTNPAAMGIVGYLLLEGPNDGSSLGSTANTDHALVREKVQEIKEREEEKENEAVARYLEERPDYVTQAFERETGEMPDDAPDEFEQFCEAKARSTYKNDDGSWDQDDLIRIALSHLDIKETHDYAGRWGGTRVALSGDYSERGWYTKTREHTVVKLPSGEETRIMGVREEVNPDGSRVADTPISVDDIPQADSEGDLVEVRPSEHDGDECVVGEVIRVEPPEWDDITEGVIDEFRAFTSDEWYDEATGSGQVRPNMVITRD